jgi:hypothetical protein
MSNTISQQTAIAELATAEGCCYCSALLLPFVNLQMFKFSILTFFAIYPPLKPCKPVYPFLSTVLPYPGFETGLVENIVVWSSE